jgi:hypothetical protein
MRSERSGGRVCHPTATRLVVVFSSTAADPAPDGHGWPRAVLGSLPQLAVAIFDQDACRDLVLVHGSPTFGMVELALGRTTRELPIP